MISTTLTSESLTSIQQARETLLEPLMILHNKWREGIGLPPMNAAQFIWYNYMMTQFEWLTKPLTPKERLRFYRLKAKHNNFTGV